MPTIAVISQKGACGQDDARATLAAAAQEAGRVVRVIDTDPQTTASQRAAWRHDAPPELIAEKFNDVFRKHDESPVGE